MLLQQRNSCKRTIITSLLNNNSNNNNNNTKYIGLLLITLRIATIIIFLSIIIWYNEIPIIQLGVQQQQQYRSYQYTNISARNDVLLLTNVVTGSITTGGTNRSSIDDDDYDWNTIRYSKYERLFAL